ncbi:unnamed protein product, partial [Brassica rapa]
MSDYNKERSPKAFNDRVDRHGNNVRRERNYTRTPFPQRGLSEWRIKPTNLHSVMEQSEQIQDENQRTQRDLPAHKSLHQTQGEKQAEDQVLKELDEATRLYLSCPDPTEAAARKQRVMNGDAKGQREETAAFILNSRSLHSTIPPGMSQEIPNNSKQTKEQIMEDLQEVTKQYLSCTDPIEAAARKQRVLTGDASGLMEETAASILAASEPPSRPLSPWELVLSPQGGDDKEEDTGLDFYYYEVSPLQPPHRVPDQQENLTALEREETLQEFQNKLHNSPTGGRNIGEVQRLREIQKRNSPDIYFLMETKNDMNMIKKTLAWLPLDNFHEVPPNSPGSGGLLLVWKDDIQLTVRSSSKNCIDTLITEKGLTFQMTFVYGEPDHTKRLAVWEEITALQPQMGEPWLLTVGKAIGNGVSTKIWKDSWISLDSELKPFGPIPDHALDLTVADLLTTDMKWNKKRVEELLPQVATEVQLLHPGHANTEDIFIWHPLQSGTYTTKSGYYAASTRKLAPLDETIETFGWIKDVWSAKCSPKMRLFLWSIINEAIPLGEQLQKRGISSDVRCIKCKGSETVMHTFFSCPFAQEVWKLIPLRQEIHLTTDINFKQALVEFRTAVCLPPSGIATTVLPWVLWAIWSTRNLHVFENRMLSPLETATKALTLGREWNNAQQQIQPVKKALPIARRPTGSNGESGAYTICRADAAYDKQSKRAGIAWIFSNGNGTHLSHGSAMLESITSPLVAEAIALRSGLLSAVELEHQKLNAFSDNLTLIRAINNDLQVKEIFGIVKDIQRISSAFVEISFSHLSRSLNVEADRLAKLSL